ncbi:MAG: hypothetical protein GY785_07025, partial [Gammaproteobacteria bacterium]|nr:hypothetical protein [Gammaproteobacteria bacterium]
ITIDKTPPAAAITKPQDDGYVTAGMSIEGVASDLNLAEYRLEIAPGDSATAEQYSVLGTGVTSVDNGELFEIGVLPQDGTYSLRLQADDLAGNSSEMLLSVVVDTTAPLPPENLTATIENDDDIRLNWSANIEPDLAGYLLFRDAVQITPSSLVALEFVDAGVSQGSHIYTLRAVDNAGNISEESQPADIVIDLLPPTVGISVPSTGSEVSGLVDIRGTASSPSDFKEYRLYIARADSPDIRQLLRQSPVPSQAETLAEWNTISLPEGDQYIISLEGEDINGNVASDEVSVSVDNLAPSQPTGLTLVASGANVSLSWNANVEVDVLGYLVFRNDRIANAAGTVVGELEPYAIAATGYDDLTLPDGDYSYTIVAMDDAGNLSGASQPAETTIDTRVPQASIVQPEDGIEFEQPQYLLATSEDNDIATVLFQYRALGDASWIDLGSDTELPFDFDFDPVASGLAIGDYQLRAVATDLSNQTDANPGIITLRYRDLTAPAQVIGLQALVDGGDVNLNWQANSETDLTGYHIDRIDVLGNPTRLTATSLPTNAYVDAGVADGEYRYQVVAVDLSGNEADVSDDAAAVVYTLQFDPFIVPTSQPSITLNGRGVTQATVNATVTNSVGSTGIPSFATDADGVFVLQMPLESGANTLDLRLVDAYGNRSRSTTIDIARGDPPSAPTGLAGVANGEEVSLSWNANPESNIAGYRPYRNGEPALAEQAITGLSTTTSNAYSSYTGDRAIDGNVSTFWRTMYPYQDQWIEIEWAEPQLVTEIMLRWRYDSTASSDYDIEADFQGNRVLLAQVRGASRQAEQTVVLPAPYMTTKLRLTVREDRYFYLSEIAPLASPLVNDTSFVETAPDGVQQYTLTAVNTLGFESQPSAAAEVPVGDVTPPDAVTLTAVADGSDTDLSWSESTATDIGSYDIYRDGLLITSIIDTAILTFRDLGLTNGTYVYQVVAVDQVDNQSAPSNEETVVMINPGSFDLSVVSGSAGSALQLNWFAPAGLTPTEYRILRGDIAGGPYSEIDRVDGSVLDYLDANLQNEITRYFLVVAVDENTAHTALSFEANGTPLDTTAPNTPVLYSPTQAGVLYFTEASRVTITGSTEPGADVELIVDGQNQQTTALTEAELGYTDIFDFDNERLSPNGELLVYEHPYLSRVMLYDLATQTEQLLYQSPEYLSMNPRWFADGRRIVFIDESSSTYNRFVRIYSLDDMSLVDVTDPAGSDVSYAQPSPDGTQLVLLGSFDDTGQTGLWLFDLTTGDKTLLREGSTYFFSSPQWSPDSERIALLNRAASPEVIEIYEVTTATTQVVGQNTISGNPVSWSPDSSSIAYSHFDSTLGYYVVADYSLATAQVNLLVADPDIDPRNPQWSPDGGRIAYYDDYHELRILDIASGEDSVLLVDGPLYGLEQWVESGHLLVNADYMPLRVTPPGYFEFADVNLNLGENEFAAVASDASGNISSVSDSIVVVRNFGDLPDLSVLSSDIVQLPAAPRINETTTLGITVRNLGQAGSVPASLSVLVIDPVGQSTQLLTPPIVGSLAPGASQTITAEWPLGSEAGEYTLVVAVDSENAIFELNEANNTSIMSQLVSDESGLISTIAMDADGYASHQSATIMIAMSNNGDVFDGRFEVNIEDGQGGIVAQLVDEALQSLAFGGSISQALEWNTANTFAGGYRAVIRVLDDASKLVTSESSDFNIYAGFQVDAGVTTDRSRYGGNSNLRVTGTIAYTVGNTLLDGAVANLRILNSSGKLMTESIQPVTVMIPGGSTAVSTDWNTGIQPQGLYGVELLVVRDSEILAQAQSEFVIESDSIQLSGSLLLGETSLGAGATQQASFEISNAGNVGFTQLPVIVSLLDADAQTVLQSQTLQVDIDVNDVATGSADFATAGLALDTYRLLLQAEVTDAGGQTSRLNLDGANFSLQDRIPPAVILLQPMDNGFINSAAELRFTAEDGLNAVDQTAYQIDGDEWLTATVRDATNSEYGGLLPALGEGSYTLRARAVDSAGNTGFSDIIGFNVDNTPPVITIDGVTDGAVYSGTVVPTITIDETNLAETLITLEGELYASGTPIAAEGRYHLFVEVIDMAGNISQAFVSFVIDSGPPVIEISGIVDGQLTNIDVTPEITITDANLETASISLNGYDYTSGTSIIAEGDYQLLVSAADSVGNSSSQTINFSIDLTSPVIVVSEPQDGITVDTSTIDVRGLTEPSAIVTLTTDTIQVSELADESGLFAFNGAVLIEGENLFTLSATDPAGNISSIVPLSIFRLSAQQINLSGDLLVKPRVVAWVRGGRAHLGHDPTLTLEQMLEDLLGENEVKFKLAQSHAEFRRALASQVYNVALIVDVDHCNGHDHGHRHAFGDCSGHCDDRGHGYDKDRRHNRDRGHSIDCGHNKGHGNSKSYVSNKGHGNSKGYVSSKGHGNSKGYVSSKGHGNSKGYVSNKGHGHGHGYDDSELRDQVKLSVAGGIGLVMISTDPDNSNKLLDIMGAKIHGRSANDFYSQISLIDSPIGEGNLLDIRGRGVALKNNGGVTVGTHLPDNKPALIVSNYRDGKTALIGFNPVDLVDPEQARNLLTGLIRFAAPQTVDLFPGGVLDLLWTVSEVDPPLSAMLTQISDLQIGLLSAVDGEIADVQTIVWHRDIDSEQDEFNAVIRLPFEQGDFLVSADLAENGVVPISLQSAELLVTTDHDRHDLGAALVAEMQTIEPNKKRVRKKLDKATELVQTALDTPLDTINAVDSALEDLVNAYEKLEDMRNELPDIQTQVGLLYRLYQLDWYRLTTEDGQ